MPQAVARPQQPLLVQEMEHRLTDHRRELDLEGSCSEASRTTSARTSTEA
jgi:hypothetical protein